MHDVVRMGERQRPRQADPEPPRMKRRDEGTERERVPLHQRGRGEPEGDYEEERANTSQVQPHVVPTRPPP